MELISCRANSGICLSPVELMINLPRDHNICCQTQIATDVPSSRQGNTYEALNHPLNSEASEKHHVDFVQQS